MVHSMLRKIEEGYYSARYPSIHGLLALRLEGGDQQSGYTYKLWSPYEATILGRRVLLQFGREALSLVRDALNRDGVELGCGYLRLKEGKPILRVSLRRSVETPNPLDLWLSQQPLAVVSVDLGISNLAVTTVMDRHGQILDSRFVSGQGLQCLWQRCFKATAKAQSHSNDGLRRRLWQSLARTNDHYAHIASKAVVDMAKRWQGKRFNTIIVLEDLNRFQGDYRGSTLNRKLAMWIQGRISKYVEHKAAWIGIAVTTVNAAYTSQRKHCLSLIG
jgi:IS605 OrfB family transposase